MNFLKVAVHIFEKPYDCFIIGTQGLVLGDLQVTTLAVSSELLVIWRCISRGCYKTVHWLLISATAICLKKQRTHFVECDTCHGYDISRTCMFGRYGFGNSGYCQIPHQGYQVTG